MQQPAAGRAGRTRALPWLLAIAALTVAVATGWTRIADRSPGVGVSGLVQDWRVERARETLEDLFVRSVIDERGRAMPGAQRASAAPPTAPATSASRTPPEIRS